MAIEILSQSEVTGKGAGQFTLPPSFNIDQHAAKWVKKGPPVQAAAEREHLLGTRMTADGWAVWKGDDKKPHTITITSGEYILLFRPKAIQDAVNAIYGNVGKERMMSEKKGHTVLGAPKTDPGLLGEEALAKQLGGEGVADEDGDVKLNKVDFGERVEKPELETAS